MNTEQKKTTKPIIHSPWFYIPNIFIFILFLILFVGILFNGQYEFSFTSQGYTTFLDEFKLPFTVLAAMIPWSAFFISYARSEQSRKQIELLSETNNFSNYYKHIEEFEKHLQKNIKNIDNYNINYLYKEFYPNSSNGEYSVDEKPTKEIERLVNTFSKVISSSADKDFMVKKFEIRKYVVFHLHSLIEYLNAPKPVFLDNHIDFLNGKLKILANRGGESVKFIYLGEYYKYIKMYYKVIDEILKFDTKNSYRSLSDYHEHFDNFYKKMDSKDFTHYKELFEGEYCIKGFFPHHEFKLLEKK